MARVLAGDSRRLQGAGESLLCPAASEPIPYNQPNRGFGNLSYAWSGRFLTSGTSARFSASIYRDSSYGYNKYLTAGGGFGRDGKATHISSARPLSEVPVFMDAVFADFAPTAGSPTSPVASPPNLRFQNIPLGAPDHWRFLIARHGRAINVFFGDGSAGVGAAGRNLHDDVENRLESIPADAPELLSPLR